MDHRQNSLDDSLGQNYPNPFNPTTTINYTIPDDTYITLKIYDVLGREVETLIEKEHSEGNYKVEFNTSNFTNGVCICRINAVHLLRLRRWYY